MADGGKALVALVSQQWSSTYGPWRCVVAGLYVTYGGASIIDGGATIANKYVRLVHTSPMAIFMTNVPCLSCASLTAWTGMAGATW